MSAMLESLLTPAQRADACKADTRSRLQSMADQATAEALPPIPEMPSDSPLWRAVIAHGDESYSGNHMIALRATIEAVETAVADMMRAYALEALALRRKS